MGQELPCQARHLGQLSTGKAYLEGDHLLFRGEFRVRVPLVGARVSAQDGWLRVNDLELDLGAKAADWAHRILHPKSLADKLGLKPGLRVGAVGFEDPSVFGELSQGELDVLFYQVRSEADLKRFPGLQAPVVWLVHPKGAMAATVRAAAREAGWVDIKVVGFSPDRTALKLVRASSRRDSESPSGRAGSRPGPPAPGG